MRRRVSYRWVLSPADNAGIIGCHPTKSPGRLLAAQRTSCNDFYTCERQDLQVAGLTMATQLQ